MRQLSGEAVWGAPQSNLARISILYHYMPQRQLFKVNLCFMLNISFIKEYMQNSKESNRKTYATKKHHQRLEKQNRKQLHEGYQFDCFQDMTPQNLLKFMQEKYDDISAKNVNVIQMSQAILSKISAIKEEFYASNKKQLIDFLIKGGLKEVTEEQYKQIFNQTKLYIPLNGHGIRKKYKDISLIHIIIHRHDAKLREERLLYCSKLPKEWQSEITIKRLKKDAILFLENFLIHCEKIQEARSSL